MLVRSFVRPNFPVLILDFLHLDSLPSLQNYACLGSTSLAYGWARYDSTSLVRSFVTFGLAFSLFGLTCLELFLLLLEHAFVEPLLLPKSYA